MWFQRASDVVRKMRLGDIDLGIVGYDMFCELGEGDPDLIVVHEALAFGQCHLALGVPATGKFANVDSLEALRDMGCWTEETPLRVVTGEVRAGACEGHMQAIAEVSTNQVCCCPTRGTAWLQQIPFHCFRVHSRPQLDCALMCMPVVDTLVPVPPCFCSLPLAAPPSRLPLHRQALF